VRSYARLFAIPGSRSLAFWGFLARIPLGMITLSLLLIVRQETGSLAQAALVSGINAVGAGVTGPVQGPMFDRFGISRVLIPLSLMTSGCLLATLWCVQHASLAAVMVASGLAGFTRPQVTSCTRAIWVSLCDSEALRFTASALEGTAAPVFMLVGPLLVTAILSLAGTKAALLSAVALTLVGQAGLAALPAARRWRSVRIRRGHGSALKRSPALRWLIATITLSAVAGGAVTLGLTAFAAEHRAADKAGLLFAAVAVGGLAGGIFYGGRRWPWPLNRQLAAVLVMEAAGILILCAGGSLAGMTALAVVAGLLAAPSTACAYHLASALAPSGALSETFSWVATVGFLGASLGQAAGGAVAGAAGSKAALVGAAAVALLGALVATAVWLGATAATERNSSV
jgi:MFS family permease